MVSHYGLPFYPISIDLSISFYAVSRTVSPPFFCFYDELFNAAIPTRDSCHTTATQEEMLPLQHILSWVVFVFPGIMLFAPAKNSFEVRIRPNRHSNIVQIIKRRIHLHLLNLKFHIIGLLVVEIP